MLLPACEKDISLTETPILLPLAKNGGIGTHRRAALPSMRQ